MLPLSVFLITLLSHSPRMIYVKALSSILLAIQSLIVCAKIIYFNSVSSELAQYTFPYAEFPQSTSSSA